MEKIICENDFCIYWEENRCLCQYINLNESGIYMDAIHVNIEEEILYKKRKELLNKYKIDENDIGE